MKRALLYICFITLLFAGACAVKRIPAPVAVTMIPTAEPRLQIEVEPTPAHAPAPTPEPTPDLLAAAQGEYTFAWISDTQHYSEEYPDVFRSMTAFIRDNVKRLELRYTIHTGDLVQDVDDGEQWSVAQEAMASLEALPHGVCAGNHDLGSKSSPDYSEFSKRFGADYARARACCAGVYGDNHAHYDLIDAGSTRYVFAYISYPVDSDAVEWLNSVFSEHGDRVGILCTHEYFTTDVERTENGERLFKKVVRKNPNVYMVLCGHRYTLACETETLDDDGDGSDERTVYQIMANYQALGEAGGDGYIRFMRVNEAEGVIKMFSYSPYLDDHVYFDNPGVMEAEKYLSDPANEQFTVAIPWSGIQ